MTAKKISFILVVCAMACTKTGQNGLEGTIVHLVDCGALGIQTSSALFVDPKITSFEGTATLKDGQAVVFSYVRSKSPGINICMVNYKSVTLTSLRDR